MSDSEDDGGGGGGGGGDEYVYSDDDYQEGAEDPDLSPARAAAAKSMTGHSHVARAAAANFISSVSGPDYRLLSPDEIELEQTRIISDVATIFDIPAECANTLLIHFQWNKEKLLDRYSADPAAARAEAGIAHLGVSTRAPAPFTCDMCLNDCAAADSFALGCKHYFCRSCWAGYLSAIVADQGRNCIFTKCPAHADGCTEAVTRSVVDAMATPDVAAKWHRFELQQFVSISKSMAWCPNPACSNAFVAKAPVRTAACACGMKFCFKCGKPAHEPVSCERLEEWLVKCGNESETANWILVNTKKCPTCGVRIEKNQGCNHIKCSNRGCRFEFCWVCLGPWGEHGQSTGGYYRCNKFRGAEGAAAGGAGGGPGPALTAAARAKQELDRYLFYYQRYGNHDAAGRFAAKHREATARRMGELQAAGGLAYSDVTFLDDATEALLECRRALKYTYVFGYYMAADGPEKGLFEHLQEQLERSTEHLAELTEQPVDKLDRVGVVDFTRVTMQFLRNLLTGIEDGLTAA